MVWEPMAGTGGVEWPHVSPWARLGWHRDSGRVNQEMQDCGGNPRVSLKVRPRAAGSFRRASLYLTRDYSYKIQEGAPEWPHRRWSLKVGFVLTGTTERTGPQQPSGAAAILAPALCVPFGILHTEYTGWYQNDFSACAGRKR